MYLVKILNADHRPVDVEVSLEIYRVYEESRKQEERQRYELLRGAYALPAEVKGGRRIATVADHDAAFLARFQHTGE